MYIHDMKEFIMKKILITAAGIILTVLILSSCKQQGTLAPSTFDGLNGPVQTISGGGISINNWEPDPFAVDHNSNETLMLNTNTAYVEEGAGSAQIYCNPLSATEPITLYKDFGNSNVNLTNRIVSIWMYTPSNLTALNTSYYLDLYTTTISGIKEIYSSNTYSTGWTQISFKIPANTDDYTYVSAIKFSLEALTNVTPPSNFIGTIYFDEISW
jgi:hypothetical protein